MIAPLFATGASQPDARPDGPNTEVVVCTFDARYNLAAIGIVRVVRRVATLNLSICPSERDRAPQQGTRLLPRVDAALYFLHRFVDVEELREPRTGFPMRPRSL